MSEIFGAKVSRKGFDVDSASDKQLAFSSEWPLLPIEAEGTYNIASGSQTYTIYTHNLGYVPIFMCWEEDSSGKLQVIDASYRNVYATTTAIVYNSYTLDSFTLHYKIFRRKLLQEYDAGTINSTDATEKDSGDFGIIVSLPGKDITSEDKRDFGIRSDVRQLMVHKSGYTTSSTLGGTVVHDLGYNPMYWMYAEEVPRNPSGSYSLIAETDDFVTSSTDTEFNWIFYGFSGFKWAYILFKDPLNEVG